MEIRYMSIPDHLSEMLDPVFVLRITEYDTVVCAMVSTEAAAEEWVNDMTHEEGVEYQIARWSCE